MATNRDRLMDLIDRTLTRDTAEPSHSGDVSFIKPELERRAEAGQTWAFSILDTGFKKDGTARQWLVDLFLDVLNTRRNPNATPEWRGTLAAENT